MLKIFSDAVTQSKEDSKAKDQNGEESEDIEDIVANLAGSINLQSNDTTVMNESYFKFE